MKTRLWIVALAVFAAIQAPAAIATEPEVPEPVVDWFNNEALNYIHAVDEGGANELGADEESVVYRNATAVSAPVEVFRWSDSFLSGAETESGSAVVTSNEWQAALLSDGVTVGVVIAEYEPASKSTTPTGFGVDQDMAAAVRKLPAGARLVLDQPSYAIYAVMGDIVSALNEVALAEVPRPISIAEFQPVLVERYAKAKAAAEKYDGAAVGGGGVSPATNSGPVVAAWITLAAGLGLLVVGLALWRRRLRLRSDR